MEAQDKNKNSEFRSLFFFLAVTLVFGSIFQLLFPLVPEQGRREPVRDERTENLKRMDAGAWEIEGLIPYYSSRFKLEPVNSRDYKDKLPKLFLHDEKALKITDTETGYIWITEGLSKFYRIQ